MKKENSSFYEINTAIPSFVRTFFKKIDFFYLKKTKKN